MCLNASPLKEFIANFGIDVEFTETFVPTSFDEYISEYKNMNELLNYPNKEGLSQLNTTDIQSLADYLTNSNQNDDERLLAFLEFVEDVLYTRKNWKSNETHLFANPEVKFENYREGVKSWLAWQDSFILSVFILLALLSVGAIVAFKVK